ncbi:MAG: hypothetical protein ACE5NA_04990, partial [Nitrospiraceae bacterium]
GESVTMVKRSAPEQAMKLKRKLEWDLYLEFLKIQFNLADRLSALYVPIQDQSHFMDGLEDAVTQQLKNALAPALAPGADDMEITMTIGQAVSESRERYEKFRFMATEESKIKEEFFQNFGVHIAQMIGAPENGEVISAAVLCATTVVPVMTSLFESVQRNATSSSDAAPAPASTPQQNSQPSTGGLENEIKLISLMSTVQGEQVDTRWGLHPRFRKDLTDEQARELSRLMNRITRILGERYAAVAFSANWAAWHQAGEA